MIETFHRQIKKILKKNFFLYIFCSQCELLTTKKYVRNTKHTKIVDECISTYFQMNYTNETIFCMTFFVLFFIRMMMIVIIRVWFWMIDILLILLSVASKFVSFKRKFNHFCYFFKPNNFYCWQECKLNINSHFFCLKLTAFLKNERMEFAFFFVEIFLRNL